MRALYLLLCCLAMISCSNDRTNRNPFLQEVGFRFEIDTNLPLYSGLKTAGNPVYIGTKGVGTRGVFVMNTGFDFAAFEASCPNHAPNNCSTMEINGQNAICACEEYEYSLFTGQLFNPPEDVTRIYNMLQYQTASSGTVVVISN